MKYLDDNGLLYFFNKLKTWLTTTAKVHAAETADSLSGNGTSSQIILGDGTVQDISEFITNNIEIIREQLGIFTDTQDGLVPKSGV